MRASSSPFDSGLLILVADTDPDAAAALDALLGEGDRRAVPCRNLTETIDLFRYFRDRVLLVLLDQHLPGGGGLAASEALRQIDPSVRCCLLTAARAQASPHAAPSKMPLIPKPVKGLDLALVLVGD